MISGFYEKIKKNNRELLFRVKVPEMTYTTTRKLTVSVSVSFSSVVFV